MVTSSNIQSHSTKKALQLFQAGDKQFLVQFWEFFSLVSLGGFQYSKDLYDHLEGFNTYTWQLPLVEIGSSKFLSVKGKLFESYNNFTSIAKQVHNNDLFPTKEIANEIHAFLLFEQGTMALKINDFMMADYYFNVGIKLTKLSNFVLAFRMQLEVVQSKQTANNFASLEKAAQNIGSAGVHALACIGYRWLGRAFRIAGDYINADLQYKTALTIAKVHNLELLERQLYISYAVLNEKFSRDEDSKRFLNKIHPVNPLDPIMPVKYEIMAVMEAKQGNMEQSVTLVEKALDISLQLDNINLIPDECLYLGETYENHFKDIEKAEHYYKIGQEHALRYAEHGISLTGDRKNVVNAYLRILSSGKRPRPNSKQENDPFSFATGKPWKVIKDTFQHQLILYHGKEISKAKLLAAKLNMPPTTLYSLKTRLVERGYVLPARTESSITPPHPAQDFVHDHKELSWTEINKIFEQEIMHYLYEKYGYNKHRMAKILKLSYPALINKTRELTQVNEHFLPN